MWAHCGHDDEAAGHTAVCGRGDGWWQEQRIFLLLCLEQGVFLTMTSAKISVQGFFNPSQPVEGSGRKHSSLLTVRCCRCWCFLFPPGKPPGTWRLHPVNHPATPELFQTHQLWACAWAAHQGPRMAPTAQGPPNPTATLNQGARQADEDTAGASPGADTVVTLLLQVPVLSVDQHKPSSVSLVKAPWFGGG